MQDYLGEHPKIGMIVSIVSVVMAEIVGVNKHIPPIVIETLQVIAWTLGICVSLVTLISWYKKNYGNSSRNKSTGKRSH